jgi:hypothetical protein
MPPFAVDMGGTSHKKGRHPGQEERDPMNAPLVQTMSIDLESVPGLVVRQVTQIVDAGKWLAGS